MDYPWLTEEMPGEIAMSIFLKLPVKSLVRFRSVSKSISAAVQSPDFIASHLSLQKQNRDPQILIQLSRTNYRRDKRYYFTTLSTELHPTENIQMPFWNDPGGRPVVHGPCNGLLCLSSYDRIALWNPSTREIKHVPPSTIHHGPAPVSVYSPVGFGFDPKSGDYKVIRFFSHTRCRDDGIDRVEIYSLNSNSWREIISGPERYGDGFPTFVGFEDGLMYWKVDAYGYEYIISFDLTDESFPCTTTTPEFEEHCLWHFVDRCDGHMTLIDYPFDGEERVFDLWVNKDGWIKELSSYPLPGVITPLRFWKDGQLFFESFDGELLLIDIKSGEMKNLGIVSADTPNNAGLKRSSEMNKSKPHILVVAAPGQGHINSLLHLSHKLISHGFNIIFVNTDYVHQRILEASDDDWKNSPPDELSFVSLPDGLDLEDERKEFGKLSEAMVSTFPSKLEELITRFNSESDNRGQITCVVADSVMSWTLEVALKLGIKRALHWPMAASFLLLQAKWPELLQNGIIDNNGIPLKREKIQLHPNIPLIDAMELPWYTCGTSNEDRRSIIKFFDKYMECLKLADWWLCNSIYELEPKSFELLPNLHPIGPMISTSSLGGQMWAEDASCLSWLDEQTAKSVVFVSFGSIAIFNLEQFQELALAIGALERPVLWVLRPGFTSTGMDIEFLDHFQGNNVKIVSWVPQLKVLSHPAIACFVSHCGWNSTMEGLANGVSFLCWPYYGDQFLNRSYICDVWKVGLGLEKNENGIVMRVEIRAKVERLLGDQGIRERSLRFKDVAMENIAENGNSSINFKSFIKWLKT